MEKTFKEGTPGHVVYTFSKWSNEKASSEASNGDLQFFVFGYILVIIYLAIMMGSFSRIGHKVKFGQPFILNCIIVIDCVPTKQSPECLVLRLITSRGKSLKKNHVHLF